MDLYSSIKKKVGPKMSSILDSYLKMGITPENAEGFKSQFADAKKAALRAMAPDSKMSKEEKEIALNMSNWLSAAAQSGEMRKMNKINQPSWSSQFMSGTSRYK